MPTIQVTEQWTSLADLVAAAGFAELTSGTYYVQKETIRDVYFYTGEETPTSDKQKDGFLPSGAKAPRIAYTGTGEDLFLKVFGTQPGEENNVCVSAV